MPIRAVRVSHRIGRSMKAFAMRRPDLERLREMRSTTQLLMLGVPCVFDGESEWRFNYNQGSGPMPVLGTSNTYLRLLCGFAKGGCRLLFMTERVNATTVSRAQGWI
jgi:hypothetical protein